MPPRDWPKEFIYSGVSRLAGCDAFALRLYLRCCFGHEKDPDVVCPLIAEGRVHPSIVLGLLKKPHPLASERGVFARAGIEKGVILGEFVGELSLTDSPKGLSKYACSLKLGDQFLIIDPERVANELAFVNDYRGLGEAPNVGVTWIPHGGSFHFGFKTISSVSAGEELLVDYGDAYWDATSPSQKRRLH